MKWCDGRCAATETPYSITCHENSVRFVESLKNDGSSDRKDSTLTAEYTFNHVLMCFAFLPNVFSFAPFFLLLPKKDFKPANVF